MRADADGPRRAAARRRCRARAPRDRDGGSVPWRLGSLVYVAFFGGALAAAAIALRSTRAAWGCTDDAPRLIVALGVRRPGRRAGRAAALVGGGGHRSSVRIAARGRRARRLRRACTSIQRSADRVYHYHEGGDDDAPTSSLWGPGLAAVFTLRHRSSAAVLPRGGRLRRERGRRWRAAQRYIEVGQPERALEVLGRARRRDRRRTQRRRAGCAGSR